MCMTCIDKTRAPDVQVSVVAFNMLWQQLVGHVSPGMALPAVSEAANYMTLSSAGGNNCWFTTDQVFRLMNLVPSARRLDLARQLYPSCSDFYNLFNLLMVEPVKRHSIPKPISQLLSSETEGHLQSSGAAVTRRFGGRRAPHSIWRCRDLFLELGRTEFQRAARAAQLARQTPSPSKKKKKKKKKKAEPEPEARPPTPTDRSSSAKASWLTSAVQLAHGATIACTCG